MKHRTAVLLVGVVSLTPACRDFLDVNTNPNSPQSVSANLYLPPMLHWMVTSPQFDGRFVGHYTQQWISTSTSAASPAVTWGHMGYQAGTDNGAQQWRDVYWSLGQNLIDMNAKATAEERWDLLGVGLILKAWGWQVLVDLHGPIIVQEAIDQTKFSFNYDTQEYAYQEVRRLLDSAIVLLRRTDGAVDQAYLAVGDKIYNGNRARWLKLAHGLLALHLNHYSNKASYDPARVIAEVDSSFVGNVDDALLTYPALSPNSEDRNFWGRTRNNATLYRQTQFIVGLMDGTQFGGVVDPRLSRMLSPSPDGEYRGLDIDVVDSAKAPRPLNEIAEALDGWGPYAAAVARWERATGCPAPEPTVPSGKDGRPRLNPVFTEWAMGLPAGHVTAPEIGLTRTEQLHALGNGVVPQQGAYALRLLLERAVAEVAA